MPGHTFEHNAAVHKLRDLVRGGHLGRLFYLDCARLNLGLYQTDVNVILDLAPHDISISNFVLGSRPTTVTAWASRHVHPEHEDVAYLRLDYADLGVRTHIHVSWLDPHKVRRITAVGSKKMVVYNDMADGERIRVYDKAAIPPDESDGPLSGVAYHLGDVVSPYVAFAEPLAVQDQHFVDCITSNSVPSGGREQRRGRGPGPGMRPDLAAGAAARGPGRGGTAARRRAAHAGRGAGRDTRWLTRQRGMDQGSEVASGMTPVPFTDLAAMASEVWPDVERTYLACLLDGAYIGGSRGHILRARVGRLLRRRSCGRCGERNGRPAAQPDRTRHTAQATRWLFPRTRSLPRPPPWCGRVPLPASPTSATTRCS